MGAEVHGQVVDDDAEGEPFGKVEHADPEELPPQIHPPRHRSRPCSTQSLLLAHAVVIGTGRSENRGGPSWPTMSVWAHSMRLFSALKTKAAICTSAAC